MYYCRYSSPLGNLLIAGAEDAVVYCLWEDTIDERMMATWEEDKSEKSTALTETCRQLTEYFAGTRKVFRLPLCLNGTPFQRLTWLGCNKVPYGEDALLR